MNKPTTQIEVEKPIPKKPPTVFLCVLPVIKGSIQEAAQKAAELNLLESWKFQKFIENAGPGEKARYPDELGMD